jgi:hypothetical protein
MEYLAKFSNVINLTLSVLTISGHIYVTDLLLNNKRVDGKLCFTTKVDTKALIAFLAIGIFLELWGFLKIILSLAGVNFPIGCGESIKDFAKKKRNLKLKQVSGKMKTTGKALKSFKGGKAMIIAAIFLFIVLAFIVGSNLAVYIILMTKLNKATTDPENPKNKCITLSSSDYVWMKNMIYLNWTVLIGFILYNTWVDVWCPVTPNPGVTELESLFTEFI